MGGVLKNVLLTGLMVVAATMATAGLSVLVFMLGAMVMSPDEFAQSALIAMPVALLAAVAGAFFSLFTLVIAALTMPPALTLTRACKLPRPLFDIFGGGSAGVLCAGIALSLLEEMMRAKSGGSSGDGGPLVLQTCAMFGGGALGYFRYKVLVEPQPHSFLQAPALA